MSFKVDSKNGLENLEDTEATMTRVTSNNGDAKKISIDNIFKKFFDKK